MHYEELWYNFYTVRLLYAIRSPTSFCEPQPTHHQPVKEVTTSTFSSLFSSSMKQIAAKRGNRYVTESNGIEKADMGIDPQNK